MPIEVYDYRRDVRNLVIMPEIRSRFMRMEPGAVSPGHTHDLGQEVFLVLEGRAEFIIDGEHAVLGPGQMCVARADQLHEVRCVGDQPMTMYLSVTPHVEPTHTHWDAQGRKLSPSYGNATRAERLAGAEPPEPVAALATRHALAARALAEAAATNAEAQEAAVASLLRAVANDDPTGAKAAVDAMWGEMHRTCRSFRALEAAWNELAPCVAGE